MSSEKSYILAYAVSNGTKNSFQKKSNNDGNSELLWGNILDIVYNKDSKENHVGIWAMEPEDFEK